jgi:hypothetical protein
MKRFLTAAVIAAIFTLFLGLTAYAEPTPTPDPTTPTGTEYPAVNPFTPSGAGTVTNYATGEDGKEFYTITAPDKNVFYLVIDRQRSAENVYFLNAVTVDDLLSLAAQPKTAQGGTAAVIPTPAPVDDKPAETPPPTPQQGGNSAGMWIFIAVLAVLGGGAGWYFKIYKPKQQGAGASEYEPPAQEDETDFDDWDETDEDAPPQGEESEVEGE